MTLKEAIQKDGQRHLYVKSAIPSGTIQYVCIRNETSDTKNSKLKIFAKRLFNLGENVP